MAEVVSLNQFPVTGAQAQAKMSLLLNAAGPEGSRLFVLYDPTVDPEQAFNRVSQKEHNALARVTSKYVTNYDGDKDLLVGFDGHGIGLVCVNQEGERVTVNEWGDQVPAFDAGDRIAEQFSEYLGGASVRLAQKSSAWIHQTPDDIQDRTNAPLHIVTTASVRELQARAGNTDFGAERFRPDMVVDLGDEPFIENDLVGSVLRVGGALIAIRRATKRCPVPGVDQITGVNRKDVPKLYRSLAKSSSEKPKPIFGVYGYPLIELGDVKLVCVGDEVSVVS